MVASTWSAGRLRMIWSHSLQTIMAQSSTTLTDRQPQQSASVRDDGNAGIEFLGGIHLPRIKSQICFSFGKLNLESPDGGSCGGKKAPLPAQSTYFFCCSFVKK